MKKLILAATFLGGALFALTASADSYPQYIITLINGKPMVIFPQPAAFTGAPVDAKILPVCPDMNDRPLFGRDYPLATPQIIQDETGFCVEFVSTRI
jgi:hypothetical protein